MYSTLAGFVEPGESLEDCVHREVFEEVGVRVENTQRGVAITEVKPGTWLGERAPSRPRGLFIVRIDGKPVENTGAFYDAIAETIHRRSTNLVLLTGRGYFRVSVPTRG